MAISYQEALILHCLNLIKDERTIYSLYHLFQGKKSSQTIQDAHLYQLTPFFQTFSTVSREHIDGTVGNLVKAGLLAGCSKDRYCPTDKGLKELGEFRLKETLPPKYLNGWKYHQLTNPFWERLSLLVQCCSNLVHGKKHFIPVQNKSETLTWVKMFIRNHRKSGDLAQNLYSELLDCLSAFEGDRAILILRLTGHQRIGLTTSQAAEELKLEKVKFQLEFLNILHYMIGTVLHHPDRFPLLKELVKDGRRTFPFTLSTEHTYRFIQQGYNQEQIAAIRGLKQSTIEDHIIEIAFHDHDFDISPYVDREKQKKIEMAIRQVSAKKLKDIRDLVKDSSYFEIRLVMARSERGI